MDVACFGVILAVAAGGALWMFGSPAAPPVVWTVVWAFLFLADAAFGGVYDHTIVGDVILFAAALAFPAGALVFHLCKGRSPGAANRGAFDRLMTAAVPVQLVGIVVGTIGAVTVAKTFGHSITDFHSVAAAESAAADTAGALYTAKQDLPTLGKIGFAFLQLGFVFSGAYIAGTLRRRYSMTVKVGLASALLVVSLLYLAATTFRTYVILCLAWELTSFLATKLLLRQDAALKDVRLYIGLSIALAVIVVGIIVTQAVRMHDYGLADLGGAIARLRTWLAGYIPGFDALYQGWDHQPTGGMGLLKGIFAIAGGGGTSTRAAGSGLLAIGDGRTTNALTSIGTFVGAFGVIGAVLFTAALGALSQGVYHATRNGSLIGWALLPTVLMTAIWSPNAWFLGYGSRVLVAWLSVVAVVFVATFFKAEQRGSQAKPLRPVRRPGIHQTPVARRSR